MLKKLLLLTVLAGLPAAAIAAGGRPSRVGVMGLRAAQPGALSAATLSSANSLLWQGVARTSGIIPVPEPQVAAALGTAGRSSLASCANDACMVQLGSAAGLDRVIYGVVTKIGAGYTLYLRSLSVQPFAVLAQAAPACSSCGEAEVLGMLANTDLTRLASRGGTFLAPTGGRPGRLTLRSKPAGARVLVGQSVVGITPLKDVELPAGEHVLRLEYHGYQPADVRVTVRSGKRTRKTVRLERILSGTGRLALTSTPPGATVLAGGQPIGVTPLQGLVLRAGDHKLQLRLAGHLPAEVLVRIKPDAETKKKVKLQAVLKTTGVLVVVTNPPGAAIFVDGKQIGNAPLTRSDVPPGEYVIVARMARYGEAKATATVKAGAEARVSIPLRPFGGVKVVVTAGGEPLIAAVTVDGRPAGESPVHVGQLAEGEHAVAALAPGLKPVVRKVKVRSGQVETVRFELKAPLGFLTLRSEPSGAEVVDGTAVVGKTPLKRKKLPVGARTIVLRLKGYAPRSLPINLVDGKGEQHKVSLSPLPGALVVASTAAGRPVPGAQVKVDGKPAGVTPLNVENLKPGSHTVEVSAPGVDPVKRKVKVGPGERKEVVVALELPKGKLDLETKPPGADILIGAASVGQTPLSGKALPVGKYALVLRLDGHRDASLEVTIAKDKTVKKTVRLLPKPPVLVVQTKPPGASVRVDGDEVGRTPLTTEALEPGEREVVLTLPGHRELRRKVKLEMAKATKLSEWLEPRQGLLRVTSAPAGATVRIDGREVGTTPVDGTPVLVGEHTVELVLDRYQTATRKVAIAEDATETVSVTLSASPGRLEVATDPPGAKVLLDGKEVGTTPLSLSAVALGSHVLRLERAGRQPVEQRLEVGAGESKTLTVPLALTELAQAHLDASKTRMTRRLIMVGSYGLAAVAAAAGGVFLYLDDGKRSDLDEAVATYNDYLRSDAVLDKKHREDLAADVSDADYELALRDDRLIGLVSLGVAATAAGVATFLLLSEPPLPPADESEPAATLLPLPGGGLVGVTARY